MAGNIKAIENVRDRLEWIHNSHLSCDMPTFGERGAFIDAVHSVLATEIDVLSDLIGDLKNLLGLDKKKPNVSREFIDKSNALKGDNPEYEVVTDPDKKVVSYGLFHELWNDVDRFINRIKFLSFSGWEAEQDDNKDMALDTILEVTRAMEKTTDDYLGKMKEEIRGQVKKTD